MVKAKAKSLNVNSVAAAKGLESLLKNGNVTIVVILAEWCGACKRVKPEWLQTLKRDNKKNVALIDSEVLPNTVLNDKLNITHFPSVFEIPPNGKPTLLENVREPNVVVNTNTVNNVVNKNNNVNNMNNANVNNDNMDNENMDNDNMDNENMNNVNNNNNNNINHNANITNSMRKNFSLPNRSFAPSLEKLKGGRRTKRIARTRGTKRVARTRGKRVARTRGKRIARTRGR